MSKTAPPETSISGHLDVLDMFDSIRLPFYIEWSRLVQKVQKQDTDLIH